MQITQHLTLKNLIFALERLEQQFSIDNYIKINQDNYIKINSGKCHFFMSVKKYEHMCANISNDKKSKSKRIKLLDRKIDNELKFDEHVSNVCMKESHSAHENEKRPRS